MAIAHVCPQCGHDLARQRPQREPHYNLRLVVCACGWCSTRELHPIWCKWRWCVRLFPALLVFLGQALALFLLLPITAASTYTLQNLWSRYPWSVILEEHRVTLIWVLIIVPVITGMWLRATFNHWRYCLQWLAWGLTFVMIMTYGHVISPLLDADDRPTPEDVQRWLGMMQAFGIILAASLAGLPIGRALVIVHANRRRRRWSRRRKRWRAKGLST